MQIWKKGLPYRDAMFDSTMFCVMLWFDGAVQHLIQIGWEKLSADTDMKYSTIKKFLNLLIPALIVVLITVGFAVQEILCFYRSEVSLYCICWLISCTFKGLSHVVKVNGTRLFTYYRCDREYAGRVAAPYLLILSSYIYGLYNFRYSQIEHLQNLTEKVGSCIQIHANNIY